jgi:hypothetical protein
MQQTCPNMWHINHLMYGNLLQQASSSVDSKGIWLFLVWYMRSLIYFSLCWGHQWQQQVIGHE